MLIEPFCSNHPNPIKEPDLEHIDEAVLGVLFLASFLEGKQFPWRAWKGHDWDALERLHQKGFISDTVGKHKSVTFTEEGRKLAEEYFERLFCKKVTAEDSPEG